MSGSTHRGDGSPTTPARSRRNLFARSHRGSHLAQGQRVAATERKQQRTATEPQQQVVGLFQREQFWWLKRRR